MQTRMLGALEVSMQGLGCMGMSEFYGETDDGEAVATIHRALELGVTSSTRPTCTGRSRTSGSSGGAIAGRRDEVVLATKFGNVARRGRSCAAASTAPEYVRRRARRRSAARGRGHRPLLPASRRPEGADRGDGRGDGGAGRRRARSATSGSRRPRPRRSAGPTPSIRSPRSRASTRSGPAISRTRSSRRARARDRPRRLQPARARLPDRQLLLARRHRARATSGATTRASRARTSSATSSSWSGCGRSPWRRTSTPAQLALAWVLTRATTSSRSRARSVVPTSSRTSRPRRSA